MLELICKELGVEIGEEWKNDVGDTYKIDRDGLFYKYSIGDWEEVSSFDYMKLLKGVLKPIWKPKKGEEYYVPDIMSIKDLRYYNYTWFDDDIDEFYFSKNIVFKTKEEAIECTNYMLDAIK